MDQKDGGHNGGGENWTAKASAFLGIAESLVLILIGLALVLVALLLLYAGLHDLWDAVRAGPEKIEHTSIAILRLFDFGATQHGVSVQSLTLTTQDMSVFSAPLARSRHVMASSSISKGSSR